MINNSNRINAELTVNENFNIRSGGSDTIYIDATYDRTELIDVLLNDGVVPEDIFEAELVEWAEENGYVKEES